MVFDLGLFANLWMTLFCISSCRCVVVVLLSTVEENQTTTTQRHNEEEKECQARSLAFPLRVLCALGDKAVFRPGFSTLRVMT